MRKTGTRTKSEAIPHVFIRIISGLMICRHPGLIFEYVCVLVAIVDDCTLYCQSSNIVPSMRTPKFCLISMPSNFIFPACTYM